MIATLIGLLGIALVVAGVALIYPPAALIVAGLGIVRLAVMLDSPKETTS